MRIKEIRIEGLFDMFNHTIPLNLDSHLSIIYGINGIGKTMIFKILDSFLNISKESLKNTANLPFKELTLIFEDDSKCIVTKKNQGHIFSITYYSAQNVQQRWNFVFPYIFSSIYNPHNLDYLLAPTINGLRKNAYNQYYYAPTNTIMEASDVVENFIEEAKDKLPTHIYDAIILGHTGFPSDFYKAISQKVNVFFISTERLFFQNVDEKAIEEYSNSITNTIREKREKYDELSTELQSSLSQRLLKKEINTNFTTSQLIRIQKEIEQKYKELKEIGIWENGKNDSYFEIQKNISQIDIAILAVNLQDTQTKLKIFDDLYQKLSLFLEILNDRRLAYKSVAVNEKFGFTFTNSKGVQLKPTDLSSGEQHELVLLYLLLFKIPENSLILIDEPEISLHIDWQMDFLNDLTDIVRLRNFDILLSTHSPSIINGHSELTISLDGKD